MRLYKSTKSTKVQKVQQDQGSKGSICSVIFNISSIRYFWLYQTEGQDVGDPKRLICQKTRNPKICQNQPKFDKIFQNLPKSARISQNLPKSEKNGIFFLKKSEIPKIWNLKSGWTWQYTWQQTDRPTFAFIGLPWSQKWKFWNFDKKVFKHFANFRKYGNFGNLLKFWNFFEINLNFFEIFGKI